MHRRPLFNFGIRVDMDLLPQDLIVMKELAGRDQDWMDERMTIVRSGVEKLDWNYISEQITPLAMAKEETEILDRPEALRRRYAENGKAP